MGQSSIIICIVLLTFFTSESKELPSFVKTCKRTDPNLSKCWEESMKSLIPKMKNGISELGLRPVDPFFIPSLDLNFGSGRSVSFNGTLMDVNMHGMSQVQPHDTKIVFTEDYIDVTFNLHFDYLRMESGLKTAGQVLIIKFNSVGKFVGNFTNVDIVATGRGKTILKHGKKYAFFDSSKVKAEIGHIHMHFDKLFGDNKELNENINNVINENIDVLYGELKPLVEDVVKTIGQDYVNTIYEMYSLDVLYPI